MHNSSSVLAVFHSSLKTVKMISGFFGEMVPRTGIPLDTGKTDSNLTRVAHLSPECRFAAHH